MSTSYITDQTPAGDFEKIAVAGTAVGIDSAKLKVNQAGGAFKRAVRAFITVESNSIRMRFDGTDPDSSTGHLIASGDYFTLDGEQNVAALKMIQGAGAATVQVTLFYNI
jgi:hypothetical protein